MLTTENNDCLLQVSVKEWEEVRSFKFLTLFPVHIFKFNCSYVII